MSDLFKKGDAIHTERMNELINDLMNTEPTEEERQAWLNNKYDKEKK